MRTKSNFFYRAMAALVAVCLIVPVIGEASRDDDDRGRDKRNEHQEMLEDLLDMSSERLARTRSLIERLEAMDSEEREEVRDRVRRFHRQSPEEIKRQRERWRKMSPEERKEHRRELREQWQDLWPDNGEEGDGEVDLRLEARFKEYCRKLPREERERVLGEIEEVVAEEAPQD